MADGQVFTPETKELIVDAAFDGLKPKVPFWLRPFLKPALKALLNFLDKQGDKIIPDKVDKLINLAIKLVIEGDYDGASYHAAEALNIVVDLPLIDEDTEHNMFRDAVRLIIRIIQDWIEKKRNQPTG